MVVRVDQAGKHEVAGEIERGHVLIQRVNRTAGVAQAAAKSSGLPRRERAGARARRWRHPRIRQAPVPPRRTAADRTHTRDSPVRRRARRDERCDASRGRGGGVKIGEQERAAGLQNASEFPQRRRLDRGRGPGSARRAPGRPRQLAMGSAAASATARRPRRPGFAAATASIGGRSVHADGGKPLQSSGRCRSPRRWRGAAAGSRSRAAARDRSSATIGEGVASQVSAQSA